MFAPEHFNMLINKRFPKNVHKENGKTKYPRLLELFLHDSYNCQSLKNFGPCKKNPDMYKEIDTTISKSHYLMPFSHPSSCYPKCLPQKPLRSCSMGIKYQNFLKKLTYTWHPKL